jgi:hypothetical protein
VAAVVVLLLLVLLAAGSSAAAAAWPRQLVMPLALLLVQVQQQGSVLEALTSPAARCSVSGAAWKSEHDCKRVREEITPYCIRCY